MEYDVTLEQGLSCTTPEALGAFLCQPEIETRVYRENAIVLARRLHEWTAEYDHEPELPADEAARPLDEATFTRLYNPALPTIAIDHNYTFSGSELIAQAAAEAQAANVIFVACGTAPLELVTDNEDQSQLRARGGILLDEQGVAHYGHFPEEVPIDLFDTTDDELLDHCNFFGVPTINTANVMQTCDAKDALEAAVSGSGVATPKRYAPSELWQNDPAAEYVIKPSAGSRGVGVLMFEGRNMREKAQGYYNFLEEFNRKPIIEERIRSYPLLDPETKQRLDWNVRAIISHGSVIDMYVRAHDWGTPVNKSLGAETLHLDQLETYGVPGAHAELMRAHLAEAATAIAERQTDIGMGGLDITIDESLKPVIFEMNIGNTGGLQTMAQLEQELPNKLANAHHLLERWLARTEKISLGSERTRRNVEWSLDGLTAAARYANAGYALGGIPLEVVTERSANPYTWMNWAYQAHASTFDMEQRRRIETSLRMRFPLEVAADLHVLMQNAADKAALLAHVNQVEEYMPAHPTWNLVRAVMNSQQGDYVAMRQELITAQERGASDEAVTQTISLVATYLLRHLDLTLSPAEERYAAQIDALERMLEGYYRHDFGMAKLVGDYISRATHYPEVRTAVRDSTMYLALVTGDVAVATEMYRMALGQDPDIAQYYAELFGDIRNVLTIPQALPLYLEILADSNLSPTMLMEIIAFSLDHPEIPNQKRQLLSYRAAHLIDPDATDDEKAWFTETLETTIEALAAGVPHWKYTQPPHSDSSLVSLVHCLWAAQHGDGELLSTAAEPLQRRGIYDLDLFTGVALGETSMQDLIAVYRRPA